jgi:hypothetical protein
MGIIGVIIIGVLSGRKASLTTCGQLAANAEHVVVVEADGVTKPIGIARAADILRLRMGNGRRRRAGGEEKRRPLAQAQQGSPVRDEFPVRAPAV